MSELKRFFDTWEWEAKQTSNLLRALPEGKYDFRPDAGGRSLGELAWHLAEVDAYMSHHIETGRFAFDAKPPGIERPREIAALAPGYVRVHQEAVARLQSLAAADLDREIVFFDGSKMTVRTVLWVALLHHMIHHRGQLALMVRLAGGTPPGIYGPNREEMAKMRG